MSQPMLSHFHRTGVQDCDNAFEPSEIDMTVGGTAAEIVDHNVAKWNENSELEQSWIASQDVDAIDGLDAHKAFSAWLAGWRTCAIRHVELMIEDRKMSTIQFHVMPMALMEDGTENPDADVVVESFDTFEE